MNQKDIRLRKWFYTELEKTYKEALEEGIKQGLNQKIETEFHLYDSEATMIFAAIQNSVFLCKCPCCEKELKVKFNKEYGIDVWEDEE